MTYVIAAGMHRSGSTLQYKIACDLVERKEAGHAVGFIQPENIDDIMRSNPQHNGKLLVGKIHTQIPHLRRIAPYRVLYIYRDIRDVVVSWTHFKQVSFETVLRDNLIEHCLATYNQWTNYPDVHISRYEDVVGNVYKEVSAISKYLGLKANAALMRTVASQNSFKEAQFRDKGRHVRSGVIGQWRDELTAAQIATVEKLAGNWLKGRGYRD